MHKVPENKGLTIFQNFLLSEDFLIFMYTAERPPKIKLRITLV